MKKLFLLLMAVICIGLSASAQTRTVRGTVLDANTDEPLIGASVKAAQGYAVATDVDGQFALQVPAGINKLEVSYVGYHTANVAIKEGNMVIHLDPSSEALDEMIVTGYGTQTRSSYTGSATVLKSETIEQTQVTNALDAIQGRVAGVQLTNASGAPGQTSPTLIIRGITSINAGNDPLIIVDGAPYGGDLNSISTHDIASMTVLKDAASNALYGARGANGVIVITTKSGGKHGKARVTVDAKWGANSRATQTYNVIKDPRQYYETYYRAINQYAIDDRGMTPDQAYMWTNEQFIDNISFGLGYNTFTVPAGQTLIGRDGKFNPNATPGRLVNYEGQDYWLQPDNWMDATFKNSLRQEYNFSVANGNDQGEFYASFNYLNNQGITPSSSFERFTGRLSANTQATSWLKVGGQAAYAHYSQNSLDDEGSSASTGNIVAAATQVAPIYPVFVRDGNGNIMYDEYGNAMYDYGKGMNAGLNRPIYGDSNAISQAILDTNSLEGNTFYGFAFAEVSLPYGFKVTSNNTVNLDEYRSTSVTNPYYGQYKTQNGIVSKAHTRTINYTFQQMVQWSHLFNNKHNVNILAVHENSWERFYTLSGRRNSMFSPENHELAGAIIDGSPNSYTTDYNNEGWVFRGLYDYENKYFANVSYRRDGSSRFHPDHRWGNFWSFGVAWMINKEKFFNVKAFDMLKFKASYGEQGNDRIGNYRYTTTYDIVNNNGSPAAVPSSMGNPNISWEKGGNFNVGFDFSLWNSRLSGTVEGFYRRTTDMLSLFYLPSSFGFTSYYDNIGDMMNGGIEVDLAGTVIQTRDFTWGLNLNFTWYKNKITRIAEKNRSLVLDGHAGYTSGSYFYGEGLPLYTFYIQEYAGVNSEGMPMWYQDVLDADKKPTGERTTTTDYSQATQYAMGSALPPCYGGFGTSMTYRDFDLAVDFAYQIGGQVLDSDYAGLMGSPSPTGTGGSAIHADILDSWTKDKPNAEIPIYKYGMNYNSSSSSRFLTDASYLMLKSINFGYTIPQHLTRKLTLDKVRVYFSADNVWLWSQRQGLNPSQSIAGSANNTYYTPMRTLSGGINVTF